MRSPARMTMVLMLVAAAACGAARARAQQLPQARVSPMAKPPATPQARKLPQAPVIVANVSLVNLVFSVESKHGGYVPDLKQADFRVLENGAQQHIEFFSAESALPLTLGLLLDTSPSQAGVLGEEQQLSDAFFRQVLRPKDLAFAIGFDVQVRLLADLTAQVGPLAEAINTAHIGGGGTAGFGSNPGTFPGVGTQGATHLWDAIYLACHDELAQQVGRKAIIVVTDGGEQGSSYTHQDALRAALASNTSVFVLMTVEHGGMFGGYDRGAGPGQLKQIAEETGGRVIPAGKHMSQAFQQLAAELRSQYSLGYHSTDTAENGKFRRVKISLTPAAHAAHPGATIRARSGYFAPEGAKGKQ